MNRLGSKLILKVGSIACFSFLTSLATVDSFANAQFLNLGFDFNYAKGDGLLIGQPGYGYQQGFPLQGQALYPFQNFMYGGQNWQSGMIPGPAIVQHSPYARKTDSYAARQSGVAAVQHAPPLHPASDDFAEFVHELRQWKPIGNVVVDGFSPWEIPQLREYNYFDGRQTFLNQSFPRHYYPPQPGPQPPPYIPEEVSSPVSIPDHLGGVNPGI
jgi:hypothetical protein